MRVSPSRISQAIVNVGVFSPNRGEALALTGDDDIETALGKLTMLAETVIIKNGADGCLCSQGGEVSSVAGIDVEVVDTTGAGDNFNCGFIYGQVRGYSLHESLRIGNICGGLSTTVFGGSNFEVYPEMIGRLLSTGKLV